MVASKHQDTGHADVLIVGAGASGGVAALRLLEAGLTVTALEQGQWHEGAEYRGSEWDWELTTTKQWSQMPEVRNAPADYPIDVSGSDMSIHNFNGVGGGTVLFNAIWPRLLPSNYTSKSRFGIADDWPIGYDELQRYYEEVDRQIGVSGLGGNPAYPQGQDPPLPPLPFGPGAMKVARVLHAKGWHWWPDTNAIISLNYDGRRQCVGRGTCGQGCNEGAKSSIDVTHWRRFVAKGGVLKTSARVTRITVDDDGLATGALWLDKDGTEHFQSANIVLCAANGIGTPRLLLASACDRFPSGLANSTDLVGRRLMMHPLSIVRGFFHEPLESWQGHFGSTVQCLEFGQDDPRRGFRGGAKWSLHPMGLGPLMESFNVLMEGGGGSDYHRRHAQRLGHGLQWSILCEDLPEEENRVVLSATLSDSAGVPAPKILYRYSADSVRALEWNTARATEVLEEAGAWKVEALMPVPGNAHLMGTARMGNDPSNSVVDKWCMTHDIPNLGIIDGSVFVTAGAVNPTATICALALRAADHLIEHRKAIPTPKLSSNKVFDLKPRAPLAQASTCAPVIPGELSPKQTRTLIEMGDELIPAIDDVPAAGTLVAQTGAVRRVLSVRADLWAGLLRALQPGSGNTRERVVALSQSDQAAWVALVTVVAGGYYLDTRVRTRIGYAGQVPRPEQPERLPQYMAEGLLDHLLDEEWYQRWSWQQL